MAFDPRGFLDPSGSLRPTFLPTFQQGYFYPPSSSTYTPLPAASPELVTECYTTEEAEAEEAEADPNYVYYVRIINPKKKSDFMVRIWHDEHMQFKSPAEIKIKLLDAFLNEVSNFQIGYFEPPGNTKRWIVDKRDVAFSQGILLKSGNKFPTKKFLHRYVC